MKLNEAWTAEGDNPTPTGTHDYLYLAAQERLHLVSHKKRPGKQSNLTRPRTSAKGITTTVKRTFADGRTVYGMAAPRAPKRGSDYSATPASIAADYSAERAERLAALQRRVAGSTATADHWSSKSGS